MIFMRRRWPTSMPSRSTTRPVSCTASPTSSALRRRAAGPALPRRAQQAGWRSGATTGQTAALKMRGRHDAPPPEAEREPAIVRPIASSALAEANLGKRKRLMLLWEFGRLGQPIQSCGTGRGPNARSRGRLTLAPAGHSKRDVGVRRADCGSSGAQVTAMSANTPASALRKQKRDARGMSLRASGCLPSHQVGDLVRAGAVVGSERVAVAGELESGVEHPVPSRAKRSAPPSPSSS